ncbi:MAG: lysophospholipid acyltransferase family protein [Gammaproteobacteria bacterium]|nr:lysophospholipid acyltransferase family protein [Gammaproteobacteria bacterium]
MAQRSKRFAPGRFAPRLFAPRLFAPRYWPSWLAVGVTWLLGKLPLRGQRSLASWLADRLADSGNSRIAVVRRNLELCFPELSEPERRQLARDHLHSVVLLGFDLLNLIWGSRDKLLGTSRIEGREHLDAALAAGAPLLLVTGHFTTFLTALAALSEITPFHVVYRRMDNPVLEQQLYQRGARKFPLVPIHRKEIRRMLRELGESGVVAILPDQDFGLNRGVFVPFFGIATATITAIPQYAAQSGARVLLFSSWREGDGVVIKLEPMLEHYPSGDDVADTHRWSDWLEAQVRHHPADYFWLHKRFKTQPPGEPDRYRQRAPAHD